MDESRILGEDLPLPPERLFERLGHISGYTWDQSIEPVHSSYDHWHVDGIKHSFEPDPTFNTPSSSRSKESTSNHTSPKTDTRPFFRHHWRSSLSESSSDISSSRNEHEPAWIPVIARVSSHVIRLEREFHMLKSIIETSDPEFKHTIRPIDIIRLPPQPGDRGPLLVTLYESPGPNHLAELVNFGPAFFQANGGNDFPGVNLEDKIQVSTFLDFAIGACECLELLHYGLKTIHGEIRADAFHFNQEAGSVRIISTGNGARSFDNALSEGWSSLSREFGVKHKLQFIAPEQTGRMPTEPDSRTDIYALGVLFWSALVGRPAFDGGDPVDVVQNVLGKQLSLVSSRRMDVPEAASAVIQKMTQKQISDRYHTISSVKWDLQQIAQLLGDGDSDGLKRFMIAQRDVSAFFTLPTRMFGRKEEQEAILSVVRRVERRQHKLTHVPPKPNQISFSVLSSGSSISDSRLENVELGDASSDSDSYGITAGRSNPASGSNIPSNAATYDSTNSLDSSMSTQKTVILSARGKGSLDSRNSGDNHERENHTSMNISGHGPFETYASLGRRKAQAKYQHTGRCEVVCISGTGGLGKSDLVHRLQPEIRKTGYVAIARLDRSRRIPFEPFFKIFASLLRQIFSERDITTEYHSSIRATLQPVWGTLHEILKLPEQLIYPLAANNKGTQLPRSSGPLQVLKEGAEENFYSKDARFISLSYGQKSKDFCHGPLKASKTFRFAETLVDVLRIMSFHKLICVCLDDIQYVDEESGNLLLELIRAKVQCVLILTGRPDEMLLPDLKALFQTDIADVTKVDLGPLSEDDILEYVAVTMHQEPSNALVPLAAVVQEKSHGIPFYVRLMLETCYRKNCIWYSWRDSTWQFDLDRIFKEFVTSDCGQALGNDFIAKRFQEMPPEARSILLWAALLGSPFSFSLVEKLLSGEFLFNLGGEDEEDITNPNGTRLIQSKGDIVVGLQYLVQSYVILPGETDDEFRYVVS